MICELCRCRQAGHTDADTEGRRRRFLAELKQATETQTLPINRIRWGLPASTATSTSVTLSHRQ